MSNNLFKAICFLVLAIFFVVVRVMRVSVYSTGLTVFCVVVLLGLSISFFVKYKKGDEE